MDYIAVSGEFEKEIEVRRSRFIASVKGEVDEQGAIAFIKEMKKRYDCTHHCYAYIADEVGNTARFSDDGEPSGTAGAPILEVLKRRELKKTVLVVSRYFGGIKLGAAGLTGAYSKSAAAVLDICTTVLRREAALVSIACDFSLNARLESVFSLLDVKIIKSEYSSEVTNFVAVPLNSLGAFTKSVEEVTKGKASLKIIKENEVI